MSLELYKSLLKEFANNVGLDDLAPDEDNYCCLGFDEKIVLHLQLNEEADALMLFSQLGKIEENMAKEVYPKLLKANLFWQGTGGATIGVDDETNEVLMCFQTPIAFLNSESFEELMEGFINTAELWIHTLEALSPEEKPELTTA